MCFWCKPKNTKKNLTRYYIYICTETKENLKEFERRFKLIEKFKNKKDTNDYLVKNETKFFPDNNSELNMFIDKLWNIHLEKTNKLKTTFHKNKNKP